MTRRIHPEALALLKQWEGFVPYAYDDADQTHPKRRIMPGDPVRGTLTIGYGSTRDVRPGMTITEAEGERRLMADLAPVEEAIERHIRVPLTDGQHGALVSFCFNLGHAYAPKRGNTPATPLWNIAETLNKGDYAGAIRRMGLYNKQRIGGQLRTVPGLVNRRAAEAGLWVRGEFVSSSSVPAEPEVPATVVDAAGTSTGKAAIGVGMAGTAATVIQSLGAVGPVVAIAIIVAAVALFVLHRRGRI